MNLRNMTLGFGLLLFAACTNSSPESAEGDVRSSSTPSTPAPASTIASGRILFAIESGQQGTSVPAYIDATGFHEIATPADGSFAHAVWHSSDEIIFDSERAGPRHLFRMSIEEGKAVQLTDGPENQSNADIAPGGEPVAYESWNSQHDLGFSTVNGNGDTQRLFTLGDAGTSGPDTSASPKWRTRRTGSGSPSPG